MPVLNVVHRLVLDHLFALNKHVWRWRWSIWLMTLWHTPKRFEIATWVSLSALSATICATIWIEISRFLPILKVKEMSKISRKSIYMEKITPCSCDVIGHLKLSRHDHVICLSHSKKANLYANILPRTTYYFVFYL